MESTNTLGKYQILREIARSNDIIYEATDPSINRRVALKELNLAPTLTGVQKRERIERFIREAKAAGRLAHPNIVTIYDAGEANGRYYIAMEFLDGQDLQDVVQVRGAMPVQEAVSVALQMCDALGFAHSQGVIHRDIKPGNIRILPGGLVKLTDFGIARLVTDPSITSEGQVFGTPSYMSPEQVAGKPLDHRSDLFSLGIILYEMLAGKKPFAGDTVVTITYNIMNLEIAPPPGVPDYLGKIIAKACAKDPNQRYSSAEEMAEDLRNERFSGVSPVSVAPVGQSTIGYGGTGLPPPGGYHPSGQPSGGYSGAPGGYHQSPTSSPPPDPFGGSGGGNLPSANPPLRLPQISPDIKYFLGLTGIVLALAALLLFAIWAFNAAYQGYVDNYTQPEIARSMELGKKLYDQGDYDGAILQFNRVLEAAPRGEIGETARKNLGACYISQGLELFKQGQINSAIGLYQRALDLNPNSPEAHYALANAYRQQGFVDKAISAWIKTIEVGPGTQEAKYAAEAAGNHYYNLGMQRYNSGDTNGALSHWAKVVEVAPGSQISKQAQDRISETASTPY